MIQPGKCIAFVFAFASFLFCATIAKAATNGVTMNEVGTIYNFSPANILINTGDVVIWTNKGPMQVHDTTHRPPTGLPLWASMQLAVGSRFIQPFSSAGYYPYMCKTHVLSVMNPHPEQTGSISVILFKITSPTNNASFTPSDIINIVSVNSTNITRVQYFAGTNSLGVLTNSPFTLSVSNLANGDFALSAKITDNLGRSLINAGPKITIAPPPIVLTVPQFNAQGQFQFVVTGGNPGQTCVIYSSGDLAAWLPVTTNTFPAPACPACPSVVAFAEESPPSPDRRFFKAQVFP